MNAKNAVAVMHSCFDWLTPSYFRKRQVLGETPNDPQAAEVRNRFFCKKEEPQETPSHLYDRMQSGGN